MSGIPLLSSAIPSSAPITGLTVAATGDGPLVVCADLGNDLWTWDPLRDTWRKRPLPFACAADPLAAPYPDARNLLSHVAVSASGGRTVLAAGDDEQGVAFWDLDSGELLQGTSYTRDYVGALAAVRGPGPARFVTAQPNTDVLVLWQEPFGGDPELLAEEVHIWALATAWYDGRSLVAGGDGFGVRVWDLAKPSELLFDSNGSAWAVAWSRLGDLPVVVAAADPGELWVWGVPAGSWQREPLYAPLTGHDGRICAMDTATVGGRPLAVTASEDATVRVWDLAVGAALGAPLVGHEGTVTAVTTAVLQDRDVAFSAGRDGVVRAWDLTAALG
ncbi:WD40 repeat domain-containing protein [Streptomyces sp. NPDC049879]|uniref:WD40 repeat domain-containing protein n=1 Tax=Streptomyces sp. NPDC049879 TaxID=3365598 RepID=UPI0037A7DCA5